MKRKYTYKLVIQQRYTSCYGWEDCSEYETDSHFRPDKATRELWLHDVKEYRLMGYPTRTIRRRELNEVAS